MNQAIWDGNYNLIPVGTYLPTPDGKLITVWRGLEIREIQVQVGTNTRGGGKFRKTFQIWARDDRYSQGYWLIPYWGNLVPPERYHNRVNKSETAYWVGEYPVGSFMLQQDDGSEWEVVYHGCIDGRPSEWKGPYLSNLGPCLDEATTDPPLFRIVALEDGQLEVLDSKLETEGGWDSSSCPVGNRYVLCCNKDALKQGVLWTTHYLWGERKDCPWRPYILAPERKGRPSAMLVEAKKRKRKGKIANLQKSAKVTTDDTPEQPTEEPERISPLTLCTGELGSRTEPEDTSTEAELAAYIGGHLVYEVVVEITDATLVEEHVIHTNSRNTQRLMARWKKDEYCYDHRTMKALVVYCEQVAVDLYQEYRGSLVPFDWRATEIRSRLNAAIQDLN